MLTALDSLAVYFFEKDELRSIFKAEELNAPAKSPETRYELLQLADDRRLLVNRKERKRMYRVWLQAKFRLI